MEVALERQDVLIDILDECLANWTILYLRQKRITAEERNYMFENLPVMVINWFTRRLNRQETMMAHQGTIVQRNTKEKIPEDALDIFAGTNDQYIGWAMAEDGELSIGQFNSNDEDKPIDSVKNTQEAMDNAFCAIFAKGASSEESKQPFNTLQNEGDNCICATFIEGDLQGFGFPESSHSIEYAAHQEYVQAKIIDIFRDCNEDISKTVEKLNSALVRRELATTCFPTPDARGEILLVFANGQTVNIVKGDKHQKYPWGEVSQALGYQGNAETKAEPKKPSMMGKVKTTPKVENKKPDTAISSALEKAKEKEQITIKGDKLQFMIVPPEKRYGSYKSLEAWYKSFGDPDHESFPTEKQVDALTGKAHLHHPVKVHPKFTNAAFNNLLKQHQIELITSTSDQSKSSVPTVKKVDITPTIIPATSLEAFQKQFKPKIAQAIKNFDDGSRIIVDPSRVLELTKDKPKASEQLALDNGLADIVCWSSEFWDNMAKNHPKIVSGLAQELVLELLKTNGALMSAVELKKAM